MRVLIDLDWRVLTYSRLLYYINCIRCDVWFISAYYLRTHICSIVCIKIVSICNISALLHCFSVVRSDYVPEIIRGRCSLFMPKLHLFDIHNKSTTNRSPTTNPQHVEMLWICCTTIPSPQQIHHKSKQWSLDSICCGIVASQPIRELMLMTYLWRNKFL